MEEEPTKRLSGANPFEQRVLRELGALRSDIAALETRVAALETRVAAFETRVAARLDTMDKRLIALEETVDTRLRETRPIWEAVQLQLKRLDMKFDKVIQDLYETRTDVGLLDKRVTVLEQPRTA